MSQLIFRLKTPLLTVGVSEPAIITTQIREPVKFADLPIYLERDPKTHGFSLQYGQGDIKLDFTCENAHELLSLQYAHYGTDAEVDFLVVKVDRLGAETVKFWGKIDFEGIEIIAGRVTVSIIQNSMREKVIARWDTDIAMDAKLSLDNQVIIPPSTASLALPGQTIHEVGEMHRQNLFHDDTTFSDSLGVGKAYYLLPNMIQPASELPTQTTPLPGATPPLSNLAGVSTLYGGFWQMGVPDPVPLITVSTAGTYHIEIDWLFRLNTVISVRFPYKSKFAGLKYITQVVVRVPGQDDQITQIAEMKVGDGFERSVEYLIDAHYNADLTLGVGAEVYVYCLVVVFALHDLSLLEFYSETNNLRVLVDRQTRAQASRTNIYPLPVALRHVTGMITGVQDAISKTGIVIGSLVSYAGANQAADGLATEYGIMSGAQLRTLPKIPSFSFKTLYETLYAFHAAGILYEYDPVTGKETMRFEEGEWFYRGGEIVVLNTVFEYKETPDVDMLYNQLTIGYEKYPDSGEGVNDEFNTEHTYQLPLVKRRAEETIKCPLIGAGVAIEQQRRLGIVKLDANGVQVSSTSDAGTYDDDGFIIHLQSKGFSDTVQFIVDPVRPFPGKPYEAHYVKLGSSLLGRLLAGEVIKIGDTIRFSGTNTPNDNVAFKVIGQSLDRFEVDYNTPMVATAQVKACTLYIGQQGFRVRTNERLDVTGVADPGSTLNLELSPARMLRRHALFINSGLGYKKKTDNVVCTAYKLNGKLATQVKPGVAPLPGDPDKQLVREVGNISLGSLQQFEKIWMPDRIIAKARMTEDQFDALIEAVYNRGPEDLCLGYITLLRPDGEYVSGDVITANFDRASEVVDLVLRKKKPVNVLVPGCGDYADKTFHYFETSATADPNIYRFCRFSDFQ